MEHGSSFIMITNHLKQYAVNVAQYYYSPVNTKENLNTVRIADAKWIKKAPEKVLFNLNFVRKVLQLSMYTDIMILTIEVRHCAERETNMMTIETKTNGYKAEDLQEMIQIFHKATETIFGECTIKHFYYGDRLDMISVILPNHDYGHFNLTAKRVSFNGHTCSMDNYYKFAQLTFNDELFDGRLMEIASN